MNHLGVLWLEARWLHTIIGLTMVKNVVFSCWQWLSCNCTQDDDLISQTSYSDGLKPEIQSNFAQNLGSQFSSENNHQQSRGRYPQININKDSDIEIDIEAFSPEACALLKF